MLDQFECVRFVRMNKRDLSLFQFDYDQTWAMLFFRPDGTVLARYGSRNATDGMTLNSMEGLTNTMRRVLSAHAAWPAEAELYEQKRGPTPPYPTPDAIPSKTIKDILIQGAVGEKGCIHCHNVYDGFREAAIASGDYDPRERWKYPFPSNLGLSVDADTGTTIMSVEPDSPAAQAGLAEGQEVVSVAGQAIHSLADFQFALHNLADRADPVIVTENRNGEQTTRTVHLEPGWRESDISWRASMYGMPPQFGLWVQAADAAEKRQLKIDPNKLALKVRGVFNKDVRDAGFKRGDTIIEFAGKSSHHSPGEFQAYVRLNCWQPDSVLEVVVLRDGERVRLQVHFPNEELQ